MAAWPPDRPPLLEEVVLHVTHFCEVPLGDTDNLAKPIRDALQGVVYKNDR